MNKTEMLDGEPLPRWIEANQCEHCDGTGMEHPDCETCHGDGEIFTLHCG